MRCEQLKERLADYLVERLAESDRSEIETHLAACASCREDVALWNQLAALPEERPSPELQAGFQSMLEAYAEGSRQQSERRRAWHGWLESWWPRRPAIQLAVSAACLVAGVFMGQRLAARGSAEQQLVHLRAEVRDMREMVALSLLQQQSASERLRGVNWSYRVEQPDPEVLSALLQTLSYDSSVDVRLAAVDALRQFSKDDTVRHGLVEALGHQTSPLVQIALIDLLAEMRETRAIGPLRQLAQNVNADETVRRRAERAAERLRNGGTPWSR